MRRSLFPVLAMTTVLACASFAQDGRPRGEAPKDAPKEDRPNHPMPQENQAPTPQRQERNAASPQVIQMNHSAQGDERKNQRNENRSDRSLVPTQGIKEQNAHRPSYGQIRWQGASPAATPATSPVRSSGSQTPTRDITPSVSRDRPTAPSPSPSRDRQGTPQSQAPFPSAAQNNALAVHHHANEPGSVRERLQKIGVKSEPGFITDRSELMLTDRHHSTAPRPQNGPDGKDLRASPIPPHRFDGDVVRNQMTRVDRPEFMERLARLDDQESQRRHHYWHREDGFSYSHYVDDGGYDWYGWYLGEQFFWTRNFHDRWWWYDEGVGHWCFWNNGFWWWQDPNHVGDLYCYNAGTYIPCNSADDEITVAPPSASDIKAFPSPDSTRVVRIFGDAKDAFLFDLAKPARFTPVYLASGVDEVRFTTPRNGRPLQIILTLDDGTMDVVDAKGQSSSSADPSSSSTAPTTRSIAD